MSNTLEAQLALPNVFDFIDNRFVMSPHFRAEIESCPNVFILLGLGPGRAGKSERLNEIVTGEIGKGVPFVSDAGSNPVTKGMQYVRMSAREVRERHGVAVAGVPADTVFFLIDCEGLHTLTGDLVPKLRQAMFAIASIARVLLYVSGGPVDHGNKGAIASVFQMINAFRKSFHVQNPGTVIVERDIGVATREGDAEAARRAQDARRKEQIVGVLGTPLGNAEQLLVLAQPDPFRQEALYRNSLRQLMEYMVATARQQAVPGTLLLTVYDAVLPRVDQLLGDEAPETIDSMMRGVAEVVFAECCEKACPAAALVQIAADIQQAASVDAVHELLEANAQRVAAMPAKFRVEAEKSFPGILEDFQERAAVVMLELNEKIRNCGMVAAMDVVTGRLLSGIVEKLWNKTMIEMERRFDALTGTGADHFEFHPFSLKLQKDAEDKAKAQLADAAFTDHPTTRRKLQDLKDTIDKAVHNAEKKKRAEAEAARVDETKKNTKIKALQFLVNVSKGLIALGAGMIGGPAAGMVAYTATDAATKNIFDE